MLNEYRVGFELMLELSHPLVFRAAVLLHVGVGSRKRKRTKNLFISLGPNIMLFLLVACAFQAELGTRFGPAINLSVGCCSFSVLYQGTVDTL